MTVTDWYRALNHLIPSSLSCEWDNDGLMCCPNPDREVRKILLTLDVTEKAVTRAISESCEIIISHHPLIFRPIGNLTSPKLIRLLRNEIAVFSFHTRLDALPGGVNDRLAALLGIADAKPFTEDGIGRMGCLSVPKSPEKFALQVKSALGCPYVQVVSGMRICQQVALLGGAGKDAVPDAIRAGCDTFVTGEIGYNSMIDFGEQGINVIAAGHYETENPVLSALEEICQKTARENGTDISTLSFHCQPIDTL